MQASSGPQTSWSGEGKDLGAATGHGTAEGPEERFAWQWMVDAIFGYDFFISYSWTDGRIYAQALARELKSLRFECFLDSERYKSGDNWKRVGYWTLRKTRCLVLVGSPGSLESSAVLHELQVFSEMNSRVIPIDFDGTLSRGEGPETPEALLKCLPPEVLRVREATGRLAVGPSDYVVRRLRDDFDGLRQDQWRLRVMMMATVVFALIASIAAWQSVAENRQRRTAEAERDRANLENRIQTGRRLATSAQFERDLRPERGLLLAVEAVKATRGDGLRLAEAEQAYRDAVGSLGGIPLPGQTDAVWELQFTAKGRQLISASADGTARLWDLAHASSSSTNSTNTGRTLAVGPGPIRGLAQTPDGRHLVTGSGDGSVRLWELDGPGTAGVPPALYKHDREVYCATISPDGRWLATGGNDGTVRVRDLAAGGPPGAKTLGAPSSVVSSATFTPDGRWLLSCDSETIARVWAVSATNIDPNPIVLKDAGFGYGRLAVSSDSRWMAIASIRGVKVWDLKAGDLAKSRIDLTDVWTNDVTFDHSGKTLASAGQYGLIQAWKLDNADHWSRSLYFPGHREDVTTIGISPDGKWLATGSRDCTVRLWDLSAADPFRSQTILRGHEDGVWRVKFSEDGKWLASGDLAGRTRLWDLSVADPSSSSAVKLDGHHGSIQVCRRSRTGRWLFSSSLDGTAFLWPMGEVNPVASRVAIPSPKQGFTEAEFSHDDRYLVTGEASGAVLVWATTKAEGKEESEPVARLGGHKGAIRALSMTNDGKRLASGDGAGLTQVWDFGQAGPSTTPRVLPGHEGAVTTLAFSPDGRWLATGGADSNAMLWDLTADPTRLPFVRKDHDNPVVIPRMKLGFGKVRVERDNPLRIVRFSPDGRRLLTATKKGASAGLWDLAAPDPSAACVALKIGELKKEDLVVSGTEGERAVGAAFDPGARHVAVADRRGSIYVWPIGERESKGTPVILKGREKTVQMMAVSNDGRWLAVGYFEGIVRLWRIDRLRGLSPEGLALRGHSDRINSLTFTPDSHWLVTGGNEGAVRLWDLTSEDTAASPVVLSAGKFVERVLASTDGRHLFVVSADPFVRRWSLATDDLLEEAGHLLTRNLSRSEWDQFFPGKPYRKTIGSLPAPADN